MAFTQELRSEIEIDAAPSAVWATLMDFERYGAWNPFVVRIAGDRTMGSRLEVRLEPPGGRGIHLTPTVTEAVEGRRFGWLGHLGVRGIFDGAHRFEIEPLPDGRTRFIQSEHFAGILVPLARRSLLTKTLAGFAAMNRALAARLARVAA
jgi:hypothetical protein